MKRYVFEGDDPIYEQVTEYMDYCEGVRQCSPMTLSSKGCALNQLILYSGCRDLREFSNAHFNRFIKEQTAKGISPRTLNLRITHVIAMIRYFREMDMEIPVKLPLIKKLKEYEPKRVFYDRKDIIRVLAAIDLNAENEIVRRDNMLTWLLIRVSFDAGLRISELRNLELSSLNGRQLSFIGKGSKRGEAYIAPDTFEVLQKWIELAGVNKYLWISEYGNHLCVDALRVRMRQAFHAVGLYDFHPHALRHSFCTDIQKQGATLLEMQQMLRHASAKTTEIYSHGFDGQKAALFDKYRNDNLASNSRLKGCLSSVFTFRKS